MTALSDLVENRSIYYRTIFSILLPQLHSLLLSECIKDPDNITPHKVFWLVLCTLLSKLNVYFLLTGKKYLTPSKVRILRKFILYSKHAVFLALQTHSVGRPKSFLKITGHAIKPIFVTLNSLSVLFLRAEVLLSAKCNNMVCIQLYNGHKGMRYRASVRSIKMTEYRSLSSFLAFFCLLEYALSCPPAL